MPVVLKASDNTIIVDGKVVETAKSSTYARDTVGTTINLTNEPSVSTANIELSSASASLNHTIFLGANGIPYATGSPADGRLGNTSITGDISTPIPIPYFTTTNNIPIQQVSAGSGYTIFLGANGIPYATGTATNGQLGIGSTASITTPIPIPYFTTTNNIQISAIASGTTHTMFLGTNGIPYATGNSGSGRLGNGIVVGDITTPIPIPYFTTTNNIPIKAISVGSGHTMFLDTNGIPYVTGYSIGGQLGIGSTAPISTPVPIPYFTTTNNIKISKISAGSMTSFFIDTNGIPYAVGNNFNGNLGIGGTTDISTPIPIPYFTTTNNIPISEISSGNNHTIFLGTNAIAYATGLGTNGRLGLGTDVSQRTVPEPITHFTSNTIPIKAISAGQTYTIFLGTNGITYVTGLPTNGRLGNGSITGNVLTPVPLSTFNVTSVAVNVASTVGTGVDNVNHKLFTLSTPGYYNISFPNYTVVNINNGPDFFLNGNYKIAVGSLCSVIPTIQNILRIIPLNPTIISSITFRYHLRYPLTVSSQWTYNATNANVYYHSGGNVGIGITNPTNALHVNGTMFSTTFSGGTKTFKIEHPLKLKKWLYHGCLEGPRFDNIYRGKTLIINGKAEVDIDKECNTTRGMTPGTFPALNTNYQLYLQNNKTFDRVKGKIFGSKILIESRNITDEIEIEWLVIGERHDVTVINPEFTDNDGNLICEHEIL
jgi:alpha-tubulin suppressor-like RCC1 family protein